MSVEHAAAPVSITNQGDALTLPPLEPRPLPPARYVPPKKTRPDSWPGGREYDRKRGYQHALDRQQEWLDGGAS